MQEDLQKKISSKGVVMRRGGFTMIELIFVIVILGILAAVALPKFIGVTSQAKAGKVKAFVGTMNRTVLPTLWSEAMAKGHDGKISALSNKKIKDYTDIPDGITFSTPNNFTSNCGPIGSLGTVATYNTGDMSGNIYCFEGNSTHAPFFSFSANGTEANLTM